LRTEKGQNPIDSAPECPFRPTLSSLKIVVGRLVIVAGEPLPGQAHRAVGAVHSCFSWSTAATDPLPVTSTGPAADVGNGWPTAAG